jgi:hypothetical protein
MDIPIIDVGSEPVPIPVGGGTGLGVWTDGANNVPSFDFSGYKCFNPLGLYCSSPGVTADDCAFFCDQCQGVLFPELINVNTLPGSAPSYPNFTPQALSALGICEVFRQWMWSVFWSAEKGVPETPYIPPSPTNGPGVWG